MKTHYRLTGPPDAIAADDSGELIPYLFPNEDACERCTARVKHLHTSEVPNA